MSSCDILNGQGYKLALRLTDNAKNIMRSFKQVDMFKRIFTLIEKSKHSLDDYFPPFCEKPQLRTSNFYLTFQVT